MNEAEIQGIQTLLKTLKNIVIIPHKNPDGDAVGSTLALWHYLKNKEHNAVIVAPNDYPNFLKWMPGESEIVKFDSQREQAEALLENANVIFTLDFNDLSRIGDMEHSVAASEATFIMIDHHQQPSDYAKFMYSDTSMSSTCEMVYNFIAFLGDEDSITAEMASCMYTGIMTDTGSFRFKATTSTTHRIIANLIDKGAENAAIHNAIYDTNSLSRLQLMGCALKNLVVLEEYNTVYITISKEELQRYDFKKGDTEGLVNYGLSLKGIKFAAIFIENLQEPYVKMSLRSKGDFSVNEFARAHFNGGGHTNAAGGRSDDSMEDTIAKFTKLLSQYKSALN
ncbi:bifunctional oligoribonuclease/PAP phosphatase NrnA [Kordia sp. YSTF-M3]|uniref:Bifunctional oligoribonuclease/PAP phosphatase NrnA n=1 Tax=Kordia aestuariivivens TaxID=2759037 RepID=A0ABR7Q5B9_9FLAO|nr:bifunctional oligoribonuclease/PAP phosphatase NrnA [Kordia aestuariivivens]MBC8753755.1 bifunctional oligoribonuclease/PAP phosphatase NrnA [Kordia aestuariivivens]